MKLASLLLAALIGVAAPAAHAVVSLTNVALGKTVTADTSNGSGFVGVLSSLTDGTVLPDGNFWQTDTVYWSGTSPVFNVNLGGLYSISSITLQHDNNDMYAAVYPVGNSVGFAFIGPNFNFGGMSSSTYTFNTPITASGISFLSISGDNAYALSEIQIMGVAVPVPEPGQTAMLLAGLVLMAGVASRRKARTA